MTDRNSHSRLIVLGALLSPGAGLAIAMIASGLPGPTKASAKPKPSGAELAGLSQEPPLSDAQRLLARFLDGLEDGEVVGSPFYTDQPVPTGPDQQPLDPVVDVSPPRVEVSSIIGGPRPVAVIGGALHSVGDDMGDGWVLSEIDPDGPMIGFRHTQSGQTFRLHLRDHR